jgi:hypothetical protein
MGLLRTYALVFLAGWVLWLWLDKSEPITPQQPIGPQFPQAPMMPPGYPGPSGYGGQRALPPPPDSGDIIAEFQYSVNLLKLGKYEQSFVYLWRRQSWILAGVITALFSLVLPGLGRTFKRYRRQRVLAWCIALTIRARTKISRSMPAYQKNVHIYY